MEMIMTTGAGYGNHDMPDDMLLPLLEDHARLGGDHVYLYGLGEPLLDKRIFDLLTYCESLSLHTILSTNATLLNAHRRERLLHSACDHLLIGIDGTDAETYSHYRTGGQYEKVVENVRALAREKLERGSNITLVVQFIRMRENQHQAEEFERLWRAVPGIDEVRIKEEDIGLPEHRTYAVEGHLRQNPCHLLWRCRIRLISCQLGELELILPILLFTSSLAAPPSQLSPRVLANVQPIFELHPPFFSRVLFCSR